MQSQGRSAHFTYGMQEGRPDTDLRLAAQQEYPELRSSTGAITDPYQRPKNLNNWESTNQRRAREMQARVDLRDRSDEEIGKPEGQRNTFPIINWGTF